MDFLTNLPLPVLVIGAALLAYFGMRLNKRIDAKQHDGIRLSGKLRELGLDRLADFIENVVVGDLSGAWRIGREVYVDLHDPIRRRVIFAKLFKAILDDLLSSNETRESTIKLFGDKVREHLPAELTEPDETESPAPSAPATGS